MADDHRAGGGALYRLDRDGGTELILDGLTPTVTSGWPSTAAGASNRYSSAGVLLEELFVPAEQSTSCAFAGAGLNRLYVTTATEGWSDKRRRAEPGAVLVYRFDTDARGPAAPFRPEATWWATVAP